MDCITFQKDIKRYLNGELNDQELSDFLQHFSSCSLCAEELEINYIAEEGVKILDTEGTDYDLSSAFKKDILCNFSRLKLRKNLIRASFIADTLLIWAVAVAIFVYMRVMVTGG